MSKKILLAFSTMLFISQIHLSFGQTTITMNKESGVYIVPCSVNGLKLKFIFDTGASEVSISLTEAIFMLKNEYLKENDILGVSYAQLANGEITENTRINLRVIEFAGLKLYDVKASVVHQLSAPLLLGQSAISKLGKIQMDPLTNTLTILNSKNPYQENNSTTIKINDFPSNVPENTKSSNVPKINISLGNASFPNDNAFIVAPCFLKDSPSASGKDVIFISPVAPVKNTLKIISKSTDDYYKVIANGKEGYLPSYCILIME
jgi:hypothetical protein